MKDDIKLLKIKFNEIQKLGWIESNTSNSGNMGIMFEKLVGIPTNEFEIPDFGSIEIKTKSKSKYEYVTLFNCVPTGPHYHEVERIKDSFGYPDSELRAFKVFNGEVFCNKLTKIGSKFYFKLNIYKRIKRIALCVYNNEKKIIEESTYWDFDVLEEKLNRKLSYLALIGVTKKIVNKKKFFKYNTLNFYKLKDFDTFVDLMEQGVIKIIFKIGVFKDAKRIGKIHDRGTAFSIEEKSINKLFDSIV